MMTLFHAIAAAGCLFLAPHQVWAVADEKSTPPNILILYADDLGFGDLGCFNEQSKIPTPNLDQLAREGMRFTDAHSSSGICTPSRYALLTGRHHWRDFHGIVNSFGNSVFKPGQLTMAEMLRSQGYRTAAIGKWHLGWDWDAVRKPDAEPELQTQGKRKRQVWGPEDFDWAKPIPGGPLAHGFDHYFGDTVINFPPYCWIEDDKVTEVPDRLLPPNFMTPKEGSGELRPGPMVAGWDPYENIPTTTQRGVEFIKAQAETDQPFFLYFAFPSPHAPIIPNDEFDGKSKAGPYGDSVFETDDACGRILKALEESGQAKNTLVVFTADNGPERYAYARDEKTGHWSSHPFRGLKRDIYEGGHHVPCIVRWPGTVEAGTVTASLVSQVDLMATFAAAAEFDLPANSAEDSYDLMPLLKGTAESVRTTHVHNTHVGRYAIRAGDWLLVNHKDGYVSGRNKGWERRRNYPTDDDLPVELYNLKDDVEQKHNLAAKHPEKVSALKKRLADIREHDHTAPRLVGEPTTADVFVDDFLSPTFEGRQSDRGEWKFENGIASVVADPELYKKYKNHGPILSWPLEFSDGTIEFEMKVEDCQRVVFTLNGDGHLFRMIMADQSSTAKHGPSKVSSRIIAWATKSSKQNKGDRHTPEGFPELPAVDGDWVKVKLTVSDDTGKLIVSDFQTTVNHAALLRDVKHITLSFAYGKLSVRNFQVTKSRE